MSTVVLPITEGTTTTTTTTSVSTTTTASDSHSHDSTRRAQVHNLSPTLSLSPRILSFLSRGLSFKVEDTGYTHLYVSLPPALLETVQPVSLCAPLHQHYADSFHIDYVALGQHSELRTDTAQDLAFETANARILRSELRKHDCIIVPADKNIGLTVIPRLAYVALCNQFLASASRSFTTITTDQVFERKLRVFFWREILFDNATLPHLHRKLCDLANQVELEFSITAERRLRRFERIPQFYCIPKLHKLPALKMRPLVSFKNTVFTELDQHITKALHSMLLTVSAAKRFATTTVLHSSDALERVRAMVSNGAITDITTGDISELYTKLQHSHLLTAIRFWCQELYFDVHQQTALIRQLELFLSSVSMQWLDTYFAQHVGIPMGASLSPDLATLTLCFVERQEWTTLIHPSPLHGPPSVSQLAFQRFHNAFAPLASSSSRRSGINNNNGTTPQAGHFAVRYLDDLLTDSSLFNGFKKAYQKFGLDLVATGSTNHSPDTVVTFLDLDLSLDTATKTVRSDLHVKELKANTYLHWHSANPRTHYRTIVFGFVHRLYRNCDIPHRLQAHLTAFRQDLLDRCWPAHFVDSTIEQAIEKVLDSRMSGTSATSSTAQATTMSAIDAVEPLATTEYLPYTALPRHISHLPRCLMMSDETTNEEFILLPRRSSSRTASVRFSVEHLVTPLAPLVPLSAFSRQELQRRLPRRYPKSHT